jgi:nucleoside-diphosphate-sugar epimerase
MSALVAGGAGFIGSWLCDALIESGHKVICIDNIGSGTKKNVAHLSKNPNFKLIKHDIIKPLELDEKIDYVFQLASRASPVDFEEHSIDILLTNAVGTCNLLELARKKNARFFFGLLV